MFGITLPLLFWFAIDIAIPFLTHFGVMLTVGQIMKDLLRLPRPPARVLKATVNDPINGDTAVLSPLVTLSPDKKICNNAVETNDDDKYLGVIKLENHFETEYGLPSTHTMSGMLPFVILLEIQRQMNLSKTEYIKYGFNMVNGDTSTGNINNVSRILETNYDFNSNEINTYFYVFAMFYALSVALSRMYVGEFEDAKI
jgi:membrane-associated phospholipid phosphatase